jgi:hypothetical protein
MNARSEVSGGTYRDEEHHCRRQEGEDSLSVHQSRKGEVRVPVGLRWARVGNDERLAANVRVLASV